MLVFQFGEDGTERVDELVDFRSSPWGREVPSRETR